MDSRRAESSQPKACGRFCEDFAPSLWFHACSFGEVKSLEPIIRTLDFGQNCTKNHTKDLAKDSALESSPNSAALESSAPNSSPEQILLTTTTQTGYALARETYASMPHIRVEYLPFELFLPLLRLPYYKQHFASLRALVVTEAELWLELFYTAKALGAKTLLINARISTRSYPKYKRFAGFYRLLFGYVDCVFAQSEADSDRLATLGARNIQTLGNLKLLSPIRASATYPKPKDRLVIIAASTHKGEEELILRAFHALLESKTPESNPPESTSLDSSQESTPKAALDSASPSTIEPATKPNTANPSTTALAPLLILAPRHPERFCEVGALLDSSAFITSRFSQASLAQGVDSHTQVILLDALGELINCYAIADIVILGGSFVPAGGHNPLEPAFFHTKLISGSHIFNQEALFSCIDGHVICTDSALSATLIAHEQLAPTSYKPMQASLSTLLQALAPESSAAAACAKVAKS